MIYFIGGKKQREFKYFELLEKIRKENIGISESFFDVDLKENEKFLEKININSIFSSQELVVLKRAEKLKNIEEILKYIANLEIVNKEIIIDYDKEDGKFGVKLKKLLDEFSKNKQMEVFLFQKETEEEIRAYVVNELDINARDVAMLLEMIGNNPFKVRNEVAKIKIFLDGEKFDIEKIKNIVSIEKDYQIYEMTRNILLNNPADVMRYLEQKKEYIGILYSLYNELEIMYKISSLKMKGRKFSKNYNTFKIEFEEIKEIFELVYSKKFRFASFMSASKFYQSYALMDDSGEKFLERYEDRISITALYLAQGNMEKAREYATMMINQEYQPATPTFLNSGKKRSGELVSCFLDEMGDSLSDIGYIFDSSMKLSSIGGGVSINLSKIRARGESIKGVENCASGVLPIMKILEDIFSYANQLGK